jgi:hypothetical protein
MTKRERLIAVLGVGLILAALFLAIGCDGVTPTPPVPPTPEPAPTVRVFVGVYDLLGATGDVDAYLKACADAGAKGVRLFVCYSWQGPQPISPYAQIGTWTHDNGLTFPKYRLSAWNETFWTYFKNVLTACKGHGLTAWVVAEDYCSLKGDSRVKYYNPFYSSEEALGPSTPGGIWGEATRPYHASLYAKIIEAINGVGVDYLIEDFNEGWIVDGDEAQVSAWYSWSRNALIGLGVPAAKIVSTVGVPAIAQAAGYFSPHGIGRPDQITAPVVGVPAARLIYSSDGYSGGSGGCDAKGRCGVGLDVANAYGLAAIAIGAYAVEIYPREVNAQNNDRADVDLFGISKQVIKAIAWAK